MSVEEIIDRMKKIQSALLEFLEDDSTIQLIEYASFYGSIEIIKYMQINCNVELSPNMWKYAIHSRNAELIKYLEDNDVTRPFYGYVELLIRQEGIDINIQNILNQKHS